MLEYRNIKFLYHDWKTWNGKRAHGYKCNDENLLKHVNTRSFGTKRLLEMHDQIDYYLDNAELHKKQRQLTEAGITAYYADKRANGDNYTGD
tara:strand:- start:379 stop:654 length:276 start_codon:yes stop_codon:yes gene_type:complete